MTNYRWRGVSRTGTPRGGMKEIGDLPAWVRDLYTQGWHDLVVCSGDGPVPPPAIGPAGVVAEITRHPDHGRRTWWAEDQSGTDPAPGAAPQPVKFQITVADESGTVVDTGWVALPVIPAMPGGAPMSGSVLYNEVLQYGLDHGIMDTREDAR